MVIQYYTLLKIISEFDSKIGMEVVEIFTQEKDTVIISLADPENEVHLEISTDNKYSSIFFREKFARARKNTTDLFPDLIGDILQKIEIINQDRILKMSFIRTDLYILLFGRGSSNIIAVSKSGNIVDAFENSEKLINTKFELPKKTKNKEEPKIWEYVSGLPNLFGKHYSKIFFDKFNYDKNELIKNIDANTKNNLGSDIENFKDILLKSKTHYLHKINNNYIFSLIDLGEEIIYKSDNISELIRKKISFSKKEDKIKFVLEDTGIGIKKGELDKVIEFGFRGSNLEGKQTHGGGFGLTKAYQTTKKYNGRFWIDSELDLGTSIIIEIPKPDSLRS
jgi:hypothetical protein